MEEARRGNSASNSGEAKRTVKLRGGRRRRGKKVGRLVEVGLCLGGRNIEGETQSINRGPYWESKKESADDAGVAVADRMGTYILVGEGSLVRADSITCN